MDVLKKKGIDIGNICCLCPKKEKTVNHLFLQCCYVKSMWKSWKHRLKIKWNPREMSQIWSSCQAKQIKKHIREQWEMVVMAIRRGIWRHRNRRIFNAKSKDSVEG